MSKSAGTDRFSKVAELPYPESLEERLDILGLSEGELNGEAMLTTGIFLQSSFEFLLNNTAEC